MEKEKTFPKYLDAQGKDLIHGRFERNREGKPKAFSVNCTCELEGKNMEIIRFDSSHGSVYVHRLYKKPPRIEVLGKEVSFSTINEFVLEIEESYGVWKKAFIRNYLKGD